jgi:integrase
MAGGDYRPDPDADRFPAFEEPKTERPEAGGGDKRSQPILSVFDVYAKERELSVSSIKKWRPTFAGVQKEVPTLAGLSREWVLTWKDRLIGKNLSPKYVAESYIAPLRALCEWAVDNDYLDNNPVAKVKIKVPSRAKTRPQGYTDDEAKLILSATLGPHSERLTPAYRNVRRWVPWLCAYSGARVGEIAQLRRDDIHMENEVALLWITPEAGTTKDGNSRYVAVHPDLIRQGFLDFVEAARPGPLFYDPKRRRDGTDQNPQFRKIGERLAFWIRKDVKITDPDVRPSHAWRHRFKTVARNAGMDSGARDYMMGHAPATVGEEYGDWLPAALLREISKIPAFDLGKDDVS